MIRITDDASIAWLLEGHLSPRYADHVPAFRSCVLEGAEDCPDRLTLYSTPEPTGAPLAVYLYDVNTGRYGRA